MNVINNLHVNFKSDQKRKPDRAIFILKNIFEYCKHMAVTYILLSVYFSKCFDSLNHCPLQLKLYEVNILINAALMFCYRFQNVFRVVEWF